MSFTDMLSCWDTGSLRKSKVKFNFVESNEGKGTVMMPEDVYLRMHTKRPLSYVIVARKLFGSHGVETFKYPVRVTRY